jgi:hypothetical protein
MSEERLGSMEAVAAAVEIVEVAEEALHCSDHTRTRLSLLIRAIEETFPPVKLARQWQACVIA